MVGRRQRRGPLRLRHAAVLQPRRGQEQQAIRAQLGQPQMAQRGIRNRVRDVGRACADRRSMNKLAAVIPAALLAAPSLASAQSIHVPSEQRALTRVLSLYNDREASAPNSIQREKIEPEFRKAFCAKIPTGDVTGWIGRVNDIDDDAPSKGIRLILEVA